MILCLAFNQIDSNVNTVRLARRYSSNTISHEDVDIKRIGKYNENIDTNIIDKEDMKKEIQDTDINNNKSNPALHIDVRSDKHDSDELNSYPSATFELNPVI